MLGTVCTVAIVTIEVAMVTYQLNKQGVFKDLANKFKTQVSSTVDNVKQPILKRISHVWISKR